MAKPRYDSPEKMQEKIDLYFSDCAGVLVTDQEGRPVLNRRGTPIIRDTKPPTVTGLCLALGFATRKSLSDYRSKKQFRDVVDRARLRVENYNEERLYDREGCQGALFNLRLNFGWTGADNREQGENYDPVRIISGAT